MATKYGEKYESTKGLKSAQVAALIRVDIKAQLPGVKVSVKTHTYAGGYSIDICLLSAPVQVMNPQRLLADLDSDFPVYTAEGQRIISVLEAIHAVYNFDGCDYSTDYFHVRYYGGVGVASELRQAERFAVAQELAS